MRPVVETLSGLERRVDLAVSVADVEKEVQAQLKRVARTAKVPGFRPGKLRSPCSSAAMAPASATTWIAIAKLARAFEQAIDGAKLRVAGAPNLEPKTEGVSRRHAGVRHHVRGLPGSRRTGLSSLGRHPYDTAVTDAEVNKPWTSCASSAPRSKPAPAAPRKTATASRWTSAGTIDGVPLKGEQAETFPCSARPHAAGIEEAARGLKADETKVFELKFPDDYQGVEVAGKTAEFTITVKEVAEGVLPELNSEFAKSLGQAEGDIEKLKADIRSNIEREVKVRSAGRTKSSVMDALVEAGKFDVPKALVDNDVRGHVALPAKSSSSAASNAESVPIPAEPSSIRTPCPPGPRWYRNWSSKPSCKPARCKFARALKNSPRTTNNPLRLSAITWLTASVVLKSRLSCWKTTLSRTCWKRPRSPTKRCLSIS